MQATLHGLIVDERAELLELLRELDDGQWSTRIAGSAWTVRDVAGHLLGWDRILIAHSRFGLVGAALRYLAAQIRAAGRTDALNARAIQRYRELPPSEVVRRLDDIAGPSTRWLFERAAPGAQLAEYLIHHQDIRQALDLHRTIPAERVRAALDGVLRLPGVGAKKRLSSNRWIATDLQWAAGNGAPIEADALTILAALAGRG